MKSAKPCRFLIGCCFAAIVTGGLQTAFFGVDPLPAMAADAKLSGDLAKAIRAGDLDAVKEALANGADINALDERKMPPIGAAALLGKTDIVDYLAEKGADVNKNDGFGYTPLMCAAQRGQSGAVRALLKHGADPTLKGGNNLDAMTLALPKGPADPLIDGKEAALKILKDAIARKGAGAGGAAATPAMPPGQPAQPPAQPAQPQAPAAPAALPAANLPLQPLEQSPLVVKNADGTLGVGQKDGKPIDPIKLSTHDIEMGSPSLALGLDGTIHALFNEKHGPPYQFAIYYRASSDGGKTWTEARNLSEDLADLNVGYCRVIVDAKNRVYAIWRVGLGQYFQASLDPYGAGQSNLVYRVLEGGKWSKIKPIHPPGSTQAQNDGSLSYYATLDPAGQVHVFWNTCPDKWHDELVNITKGATVYRFHYAGVGNGLVFESRLDGATSTPPREVFMTPVSGSKADPSGPWCDGLDTINGFCDTAGNPTFIAHVTRTHDDTLHDKYRYQLIENGKMGPFVDVPGLSYHAWRDVPTLLLDAAGKKHVILLYPSGEHASVRDYLLGSDEDPTIIRQTAGAKGTLDGMQAYQGPGGRMVVVMQMNDTDQRGEGDDFVSVSIGGGKWSPPVNITNNALRRSFASRQTGIVSNVAVSKSFYPGPAAAAFDRDGRLLLLMVQNERGLFSNQVGLGYLSGSSTTPTMRFLKF